MPIDYEAECAFLRDIVAVDDAESLLAWLQQHPGASVDLAGCVHLHPANVQVLLAAQAPVAAWPADAALRSWLQPLLKQQASFKENIHG